MELVLESALEAIILRYSATLAGHIWTCIAFFAAALGLWRLRFFGSRSESKSIAPTVHVPPSKPAIIPSAVVSPPVLDCSDRIGTESSTKGRFTAYFLAEDETHGGHEDEEWVPEGFSYGADCWDCWDWEWSADLGWYGCQDRSAINGSVVKLWNSGGRGFAVVPAVSEQWN
ncbi:uncharacterized protein LOC110020480 [Phalaenopsis equestris]|uniref:uncharacterized protein LOC110020480 n=1 Tax=Phalaenopsis equestris TaxID=78828 RepID=UPI0009E41B54|nr:uncharacterized protein LOC110020480 [Phalaenopsis equestris]